MSRKRFSGSYRLADVARGQRALDVGCGLGALTIELARALGEEGVAALDPSEEAVETCGARISDAEVIIAPVEALPFGDCAFDVALAQLVINLVDDPAAGAREMRRVVRPGGVVAACVWDATAMPLLGSFWESAAEIAPGEVGVLDERKQVGFQDPTWLRNLWREAGLAEVSSGRLATSADYDDFDDLWFSFEQGVGRSGSLYLRLDAERRAALRSRAYELLGSPRGRFASMLTPGACAASPDRQRLCRRSRGPVELANVRTPQLTPSPACPPKRALG